MKQICVIDRGIACVYEIYNQSTGKRYIGSTRRYRNRFREHRKMLQDGSHHSMCLQRSFNKHGSRPFLFRPLEVVSDRQDMIKKEQNWIDRFGRLGIYNASMVAGASGKKPKPIFAIHPSTGQKTRYESSEDAATIVYGDPCRLVCPAKAARKLAVSKGMFWTFDATETLADIVGKRRAREANKLLARPHTVFAFNDEGRLVASYATIADAARDVEGSAAAICAALSSQRFRTVAGMTWNRSPEPKQVKSKKTKGVVQIHCGKIVRVWGSCIEAARLTPGVNHKGISSAATGYVKSHGGYQWEFVKT